MGDGGLWADFGIVVHGGRESIGEYDIVAALRRLPPLPPPNRQNPPTTPRSPLDHSCVGRNLLAMGGIAASLADDNTATMPIDHDKNDDKTGN